MTRTGRRAPRCLRCRSGAATLLPARKPWGPTERSRQAHGWPNGRCGGNRALRLTPGVGDYGESVLEQLAAERAVWSEQTGRARRTASAPLRATLSARRGAPPSMKRRPGGAERPVRDHGLHGVDHVTTSSAADLPRRSFCEGGAGRAVPGGRCREGGVGHSGIVPGQAVGFGPAGRWGDTPPHATLSFLAPSG